MTLKPPAAVTAATLLLAAAAPVVVTAVVATAIVASAVVGSVGPAIAAGPPPPTVTVTNGWFATMPDNGPTYGYFQISNRTGDPRLIAGYSSPACSSLKLEEAHGGGTNSREAVSMTVAPRNRLVFSRGGYHLVCATRSPLSPGQTVPVTIALDNGSAITTGFAVRPPPR